MMIKTHHGYCPDDNEPATITAEYNEVRINNSTGKHYKIRQFECHHRINCQNSDTCQLAEGIPTSLDV